MKKLFGIILLFILAIQLQAQNYSGLYQFNKGMNKEQGQIHLNQFKPDSAFFYLSYISGAPDFNTFSTKGFMQIQNNEGLFIEKDNHQLKFKFTSKGVKVSCDSCLGLENGFLTKYVKSSSTIKKSSTLYLEYAERTATFKADSVLAYEVPCVESKCIFQFKKKDEIKVIDSYGYFYLVELPEKNKEFLWVQKKHLLVNKN